MLKRITLTNFRKHRDLTVNMEEGLVAILARNEGGKSTLLEAMRYATSGSRALRNSLADTVTHGHKDSTLRVEALYDFGGDEYLFIRHKGGAEVYVNGATEPYVTGQNEVTNFASQLLGADAATANNLMFSSQGNLRGALEQGPKATAEMIENLADFDLFDYLIDKMGRELPLGSSAHLERTIEELKQTLSDMGQVDYDSQINQTKEHLEVSKLQESKLDKELRECVAHVQTVKTQLDSAHKGNQKAKDVKQRHASIVQKLDTETNTLQNLNEILSRPVDSSRIADIEEQISGAAEAQRTQQVYAQFKALKPLDLEWEGDLESLESYIKEQQTKRGEITNKLLSADVTTNSLKSKLIHDTSCPTCGQDLQNAEAINTETLKQIGDLQASSIILEGQASELDDEIGELVSFSQSLRPYIRFLDAYGEYVTVQGNVLPPNLSWKGETPVTIEISVEDLRAELNQLREAEKRFTQTEAKVESITRLIEQLTSQKVEMDKEVALAVEVEISEFEMSFETAKTREKELTLKLGEAREKTLSLHTTVQNLENRKEQERVSRKSTEDQIKNLEENIADLDFNNNLLKKVRLARPLVSDQLWNMVLAATSTMFSSMRGERSVVTKDKDGFKVNGEAITGLSGSTLDILGASIRVALLRTFVPNCSFAVYDEPFAAMDEDRTQLMLAFIQSCGFRQTLVVTHENISEQLADQIITL